ncbi:hypothetical protein AB0H83_08200 [Dactylosporangium sp. NPDC050688]|uniref:hypothetical protein n=1 Tax=Dactylosporangium sp. NPDC050688 TaxID=3157217 RepID=UPI0033C3B0A8
MSGQIQFSGDALAQRVPLLGQFRDDLAGTLRPLMDIAECHWADGCEGDDELALQARGAVREVLGKYVLPSYAELGESVGIEGEKLDLVRKIGDNTEGSNSDVAGGWGSGGRHG